MKKIMLGLLILLIPVACTFGIGLLPSLTIKIVGQTTLTVLFGYFILEIAYELGDFISFCHKTTKEFERKKIVMNKEELEQKIKSSLPENWEFDRIFDDCDEKYAASFRVKCPIEDRMGDSKLYHEKIDQICQAVNAIHDGGGWAIGGSKYDNFFYVKKD